MIFLGEVGSSVFSTTQQHLTWFPQKRHHCYKNLTRGRIPWWRWRTSSNLLLTYRFTPFKASLKVFGMWFSSTYAICSTQDEAGIRIHKKYIALQDSLWFSVTSHREVFTLEVFWWMNLSVLTLGGGQCSDLWRLWQGHPPVSWKTCSFFCAEFQWGEILQSFRNCNDPPAFCLE